MFSDDFLVIQSKWINNQPLVDEDKKESIKELKVEGAADILTESSTQENTLAQLEKPQEQENLTSQSSEFQETKSANDINHYEFQQSEPKENSALEDFTEFDKIENNTGELNASVINDDLNFYKKRKISKVNDFYLMIGMIGGAIFLGIIVAYMLTGNSKDNELWSDAVKFHSQKNYAEAIVAYLKYFEQTADHSEKYKALYFTGLCNYSLKEYPSALTFFKQVTQLSESEYYSALAFYWSGIILKEQRKYLEALDEFNMSIKAFRDNPMAINCYKKIIEIYIVLGNWERVIEICDTLRIINEANIDGSVYYYYGLAFQKLNFTELSQKYFNLLISSNEFDSKYADLARNQQYDIELIELDK